MRRTKLLALTLCLLATSCFLKRDPVVELKAGSAIELKLGLPAGWKINADAPSLVKVFRKDGSREMLAHSYNREVLVGTPISIGPFAEAGIYRMEGVFYYCEEKDSKICLMKKASQLWELKPESDAATAFVDLN